MDDNDLIEMFDNVLDHLWLRVQHEVRAHLKNLISIEIGFSHLDPAEIDKLAHRLLG
ncbi:hypothetical protein GCM10017691_24190 [Pseudonocardia petroleophila]|uniref:Uncharacterized protein n=1 Tax=Pseudonocardia petroleophila TaxID=37331 RepID=A0A7G7MFS6_9PSEU|nr:hypothetical protein [Pseudonocardia petroleophila]QNG51637.1 hypothetical protein H6H00_26615 [Pseudonocardia petroleophila]